MKSNSLTSILLGVLAISTVTSVVLTVLYSSNVRDFRQIQYQVTAVNNNRAIAAQLVNELVDYSKRNPAIDPLLESAGIKAKTPAPANGKPANR